MNTEATELQLYIENDSGIYHQMVVPTHKNLATKKARGVYEHDKAIKQFLRVAELGAKNYVREHGSMTDSWNRMFDKETRTQVAESMTSSFETEYRLGNYNDLLPKKYQPKVPKQNETRRRQAYREGFKGHASTAQTEPEAHAYERGKADAAAGKGYTPGATG